MDVRLLRAHEPWKNKLACYSHCGFSVHADLHTAAITGVSARLVEVKVRLAPGQSGFHLVGAPDHVNTETRVRVLNALHNNRYQLPLAKISANVKPNELRKESPSLDLVIALGILEVAGIIPAVKRSTVIVGDLGLSGTLLQSRGVLPIALEAKRLGFSCLIVPLQNAAEGSLVQGLRVFGARSLTEAAEIYAELGLHEQAIPPRAAGSPTNPLDLSDVRGQFLCKRGLEIAAAGGHNALLVGPPGGGKTILARRVPGILPPLTFDEALEVTSIWSIAGRLKPGQGLIGERPFRAPHHTISGPGLIGGGNPLRPGEVSLATHGALFLDELPEYSRASLEALRQPLERGKITLVRAGGSFSLPGRFMLIAAMSPCGCGQGLGLGTRRCQCTREAIEQYRRRISKSILDHFDLHIACSSPLASSSMAVPHGETSSIVRGRVEAARIRQRERYASVPGVRCNANLRGSAQLILCAPTDAARSYLTSLIDSKRIPVLAYDHVLKASRTIADLEGSQTIREEHINEAAELRCLDKIENEQTPRGQDRPRKK